MEYRVELKYMVTERELMLLRYRLASVMQLDQHQNGDSYHIRSLYFDYYHNSCMYENESGVDNREKYRIRIYDKADGVIKLEQKSKLRGMTKKVASAISKEECLSFMNGQVPVIADNDTFVKRKLASKMLKSGMKPVCIVEYERTAYIEKKGNVRVTFDRNISGTTSVMTFFDRNTKAVPVLPAGQHILEIKYDEFLPDYIKNIIDIGNLRQTSFSKYYLSRKKDGIDE